MAYLPRGIDPELLVSQVKNTMPYLFDEPEKVRRFDSFVPAQVVRQFQAGVLLSHFDYFKLCLSSHYLTCGTPVPTDVDNQIRFKLWPEQLPLETALEMAQLVLESRKWDFTLVSSRFAFGASGTDWKDQPISGHHGEWFTVSSAAYCALKRYADPVAQAKRDELLAAITDEVHRHSEVFGTLWRAHDGLGCLKASASVAHNFGDLDRVMDMWELSIEDPLRLRFYKLAITPFDPDRKLRYLGRLWVAGELYKSPIDGSSMASENHRHFALRKPRCLRQSPEFLVPTGPFFDEWGSRVASGLNSEDTLEVVEALKQGWSRLPRTVGYGRALRGMGVDVERLVSPESFERKWSEEALKLMDDIPSRA